MAGTSNFDFMQTRSNVLVYTDLFSNVLTSKRQLTADIKEGMLALQSGGKVTLSNGMQVDMGTTSGPMMLNMYIDQLNSRSTFVDSMFESIKTYEKTLQNTLGQ